MNSRIILLGLAVAALSSCSSAYRTGQTPDDVYYSPARETAAYVKVEDDNNDDRRYRAEERYRNDDRYRNNDRYRSNDEYINSDDRWLRMRVRNRYRWSAFDDYQWNDWRYNSWSYNSYNSYSPFNNYWNNYYSWNSFYNPYCTRVILVNPKTNPVVYNRVRNFNLNSYSNNNYTNANSSPSRGAGGKVMSRGNSNPGYNNSNSTLGNSVRKVFSNPNNGGGGGRDTYVSPSSSDRPSRVYQPSESSSSSSSSPRSSGSSSSGSSSGGSSGGSGSGGVNRPSRN